MDKKRRSSGVRTSSCKVMKQYVMKMKETTRKDVACVKRFLMKALYKAHTKNWGKPSQLASSQQSLIQRRYYLFSKWVNSCQGDGFLGMDAQTGTIKYIAILCRPFSDYPTLSYPKPLD